MKQLSLPEPISAYFAADGHDGHAVARCFAVDGIVIDEGKTHSGRAAIAAWKAATSARYNHAATPRSLERRGDKVVVTTDVAGDFPGSPVDLRFLFTLERGLVATLEITP